MKPILQVIFDGIINGERIVVTQKMQEALTAGISPAEILNNAMIAAMSEVGRLFEEGEFYVPEMLIAARAMQAGLTVLKPQLLQAGVKSKGKVAIGTIKGDLHDIGKNLVSMMLEGAGFEIKDLGTDVPSEKVVEAVRSDGVNLIALSALLTTTMPNMKNNIDALKTAGLRNQVKVMIGGAVERNRNDPRLRLCRRGHPPEQPGVAITYWIRRRSLTPLGRPLFGLSAQESAD
jgi:5-methyltetrahydrofolate--homocysteine methyltransferase